MIIYGHRIQYTIARHRSFLNHIACFIAAVMYESYVNTTNVDFHNLKVEINHEIVRPVFSHTKSIRLGARGVDLVGR